MQEHIVETKQCKSCGVMFHITDKDMGFYDKVSPIFGGKKYQIPSPKLCPDCRQQRRYSWRNQRTLYRRICDFSWQSLIAMFPPDVIFPVYHNKYRRSNENDPLQFGQEFVSNVSFLEQYLQLQKKVPRFHRYSYAEDRMINSEYTHCTWDLKDCYLVFATSDAERSHYSDYLTHSNDCLDVLLCEWCTQCYQCVDIENCYNVMYSNSCIDCKDSYWLDDCINCTNCIGCVGLRNQQYSILNTAYTKEEYEKKKGEIIDNKWIFAKDFLSLYNKLYLNVPKKYMHGNNNDRVVWDFINNSKNVSYGYDIKNSEDIKYCAHFNSGKSCMDFSSRWEAELCYEISGGWENMYKSIFCVMSFGCTNSAYCDFCFYCHDCFGCVGLTNKQYCILNKQYTKEEYEELVPKVIERMIIDWQRWEFFPISVSIFGYNASLAQEYFPLVPETAKKKWYPRIDKEYPLNIPENAKKIFAKDIPMDIKDVSDDILDTIIICEVTAKPYRIIKQELDFYRKHTIPLPRKHPDQRYLERFNSKNPRKLRDRNCMKCWIDIKTSYSPDKKEIVYCETCYNHEIYG